VVAASTLPQHGPPVASGASVAGVLSQQSPAAGLVDSERRGTWVYYRPRPENLRRLSVLLDIPGLATGEEAAPNCG
jgi:DNA-binding transcriptional ArsR family regulator